MKLKGLLLSFEIVMSVINKNIYQRHSKSLSDCLFYHGKLILGKELIVYGFNKMTRL